MPPSYKCVGYWSLGVIHIAAASLTTFRIEASILSVVIASISNLICGKILLIPDMRDGFEVIHFSHYSTYMWMQKISKLFAYMKANLNGGD